MMWQTRTEDASPTQGDSGSHRLPLFQVDDSYQSGPAEGFENSRAGGVLAFAQGLGLGSSSGGSQGASVAGGAADAMGDATTGAFAAWQEAACRGGGQGAPTDFGFLLRGKADVSGLDGAGLSAAAAAAAAAGKKPSAASEDSSPADEDDSRMSDNVKRKRTRTLDMELSAPAAPAPPRPPQRPSRVLFGAVEGEDRGRMAMDPPIQRTDVFHWMRKEDNKDPEITSLFEEENRYAEASQAHLKELADTLYSEMLHHQKEAEDSLISLHSGGYGYFTRSLEKKSYRLHYRRRALHDGGGTAWGPEEVVLDENELAADPEDGGRQRPFCNVCGPEPNPSHSLYTYAVDYDGDDAFTIGGFAMPPRTNGGASDGLVHGMDPSCVEALQLERTDGSVQWSSAGEAFYYVTLDHEFRAEVVRRHVLGQDPTGAQDAVIFQEHDKKFVVSLSRSSCKALLVIHSSSSETSESHLLDPASPESGLRRVCPRSFEHQYSVDHREGWLYIITNKDGAKNSKLCRCRLQDLPDVSPATWEDLWVPGEGTQITSHQCFRSFLALEGREHGECRIFIHGYGEPGGPPRHSIAFPDASAHSGRMLTPRGATSARAAFWASTCDNHLFEADVVRYHYGSFTISELTYEYHVASRESRLLQRSAVPNFDTNLYRADRIVTSARGVPISMVYRKDLHPCGLSGGPFPVLLTGYGAYGSCTDPDFDGNRLSLLDRGLVYALVHVRGGGEFGRGWYEAGRYASVKNRFSDFVEAAETLISLKIADPRRIAAWGTSSGGLLVSASMNLRPDLFRAALLEVPFVDAMNTMSDPSIPLTVAEWEEIGNPNEREYFYYMLEYSPYDNIRMEEYPAVLATASLNDSMVGYWEPLKYVSKLRLLRVGGEDRPVLLRANFHAGHSGTTDRYESMREAAFYFAFLLDQLGLAKQPLLGRQASAAEARMEL